MPFANWRKFMVGFGKQRAGFSGLALVNTSPVSNVGTAETDLIKVTLLANSLYKNGQTIRIAAWGVTAANANNKTIKLYFGGTLLVSTGIVTLNNKVWWLEAIVVRTASKAQTAISWALGDIVIDADSVAALAVDDTLNQIIKATGLSGTGSNDITCNGLIVEALTV